MRTHILAFALLLLSGSASALSVTGQTRILIEGETDATCIDLLQQGDATGELVVNPATDGVYSDGALNVTLDVAANATTFDFLAENATVVAVFVEAEAQAGGHFLYRFNGTDAGFGLTTPSEVAVAEIVQISFCYQAQGAGDDDMEVEVPGCDEGNLSACPEAPLCEQVPMPSACDVPGCLADLVFCLPASCQESPGQPQCQLPCPTEVFVGANADGTVSLSFVAAAGLDVIVERAEGDGSFEQVAVLEDGATSFVDKQTTAGATYTYRLSTSLGVVVAAGCETVEVTSMPDFPTWAATGLAVGLGALAFAAVRRRS